MVHETMKVLYADDHWITRSAAKHLIERLEPNSNLLEAADFRQALEIASGNPDLDLILLDLLMPGMKRFDGLRAMRECRSEERCVGKECVSTCRSRCSPEN